jgi:GNAT superfamily N-acetyltransferase
MTKIKRSKTMLVITIKRAADLNAEEDARIDEVAHLAFSSPDGGLSAQGQDIEWADSDWLTLGRLDGEIVCLAGVLYREVLVNQQVIPVGAVGGVATHPDYQRRGLAGQLMERLTSFLRDELKVPFGLLVCSDLRVHYYNKFGWRLLEDPMLFDWHGTKRVFTENTMALPLGDQPWPRGIVDVCGKPW